MLNFICLRAGRRRLGGKRGRRRLRRRGRRGADPDVLIGQHRSEVRIFAAGLIDVHGKLSPRIQKSLVLRGSFRVINQDALLGDDGFT